jgi:hypothetical protein
MYWNFPNVKVLTRAEAVGREARPTTPGAGVLEIRNSEFQVSLLAGCHF